MEVHVRMLIVEDSDDCVVLGTAVRRDRHTFLDMKKRIFLYGSRWYVTLRKSLYRKLISLKDIVTLIL